MRGVLVGVSFLGLSLLQATRADDDLKALLRELDKVSGTNAVVHAADDDLDELVRDLCKTEGTNELVQTADDDLKALLRDIGRGSEAGESGKEAVAVPTERLACGKMTVGSWAIPPNDAPVSAEKAPFCPDYESLRQERFAAVVRELTGKTICPPTSLPPHEAEAGDLGYRLLFDEWLRELESNAKAVHVDWLTPTNTYRYFLREAGGDDCTATLRACFSRKVRFASLQRELGRLAADLERRFADCGFGSATVSENAYLNYAEGVGGMAAYLYADDTKLKDESVYTMELSFTTDFLKADPLSLGGERPYVRPRHDSDFSDRKAVESMLDSLSRTACIVEKVRCRQATDREDTSGGSIDLPAFEDRLGDDERAWAERIMYPAGDLKENRNLPGAGRSGACGQIEENERKYEAMKFMNDFIHPCENGFVWLDWSPRLSRDQRRFIEVVREISGRTILPAEAEAPFVTLAEMRRRYRTPTTEIAFAAVNWNSPTNAYRYFPYTPPEFKQSPYSSTMTAMFSACCTRASLETELYALVGDLERRFADCGFESREVGESGYVNYRPGVGAIAVKLEDRRRTDGRCFALTLHFTTRLMDEGTVSGWPSAVEPRELLKAAVTHGLPQDGSVCIDCLRKYLHGAALGTDDNSAGARFAADSWSLTSSCDLPVFEQRTDEHPSFFGRFFRRNWQSMLVIPGERREVSCFYEPVFGERVSWEVADEPIPEPGVKYVPVCRYAQQHVSGVISEAVKYDRIETNACWRCRAADSFVERFLLPRGWSAVTNRHDAVTCRVCHGHANAQPTR